MSAPAVKLMGDSFYGKMIKGMQKTYNEAVHNNPWALRHVPDWFKIREMCIKAVEACLWQLKDVPDHFKTQEMCDKTVGDYPFLSRFVPDYFITQQQLKIWHYDTYYYNDDDRIKCYKGHQKRITQKASIKEELPSIAWHPSRWWNCCVPEDEKKEIEQLWK